MAIYTVTLQNVSGDQVVSLSDGSNLAKLQVNPSRGPQGAGWTGVTYSTSTGRFTFTSNDGLGYVSDDITVDLDAAVAAAQAAQTGAEAAEAATELLFDQFGDQYLGPKASDPTVDNDGNPLVEGAVYFNTTDDVLKFYSGTAWVAPELIATNAATAAQASATAAAASETNAAASESAAATSETNAAASETAAAASASSASTSETNAAASASAASTSETNAAASASAASTSETNAAASASAASTSETNAAASASSASTSASNAATSESNAAASASAASTSASNAATSESNAAASASAAAASYDSFDDRYLGAKSSDPTTDNDGNALITGALYFNSTSGSMRVYNGSAWQNVDIVLNSTDDLAEGSTNLYYTSTRFDTDFSGKSTTDLTEGTNLYYTAARFDTAFGGKSTSDLSEGTNLYYTDARANAAIDARVDKTFVDNLGIDAATLGGDSKATILATAEANALALAIALG